jgi:hypothetical protein
VRREFARSGLRQAGEIANPIGRFVRCASVPKLARVGGSALAPWFGVGKPHLAEAIPHSWKAGGQIDQSYSNGVSDIQAREEIRPVYAAGAPSSFPRVRRVAGSRSAVARCNGCG